MCRGQELLGDFIKKVKKTVAHVDANATHF